MRSHSIGGTFELSARTRSPSHSQLCHFDPKHPEQAEWTRSGETPISRGKVDMTKSCEYSLCMRRSWHVFSLALLMSCLMHSAYAQETPFVAELNQTHMGFEILSDTKGVELSPYLKTVGSDVRSHWHPPVATQGQQAKPDETTISLTIAPNGQVSAMHLDHPTKNAARDRAAWAAITSTHYPPLPSGLKDSSLKLRVIFPAH